MKYRLNYEFHDRYMRNQFLNQTKNIDKAIKKIKQSGVQFDSIACMGISGIVFSTLLSYKLKVNLVIIRKREKTHSDYKVVTSIRRIPRRFIFVDDLVSSGTTLKKTVNGVINTFENRSTFVGAYLYDESYFYSPHDLATSFPLFQFMKKLKAY